MNDSRVHPGSLTSLGSENSSSSSEVTFIGKELCSTSVCGYTDSFENGRKSCEGGGRCVWAA